MKLAQKTSNDTRVYFSPFPRAPNLSCDARKPTQNWGMAHTSPFSKSATAPLPEKLVQREWPSACNISAIQITIDIGKA